MAEASGIRINNKQLNHDLRSKAVMKEVVAEVAEDTKTHHRLKLPSMGLKQHMLEVVTEREVMKKEDKIEGIERIEIFMTLEIQATVEGKTIVTIGTATIGADLT